MLFAPTLTLQLFFAKLRWINTQVLIRPKYFLLLTHYFHIKLHNFSFVTSRLPGAVPLSVSILRSNNYIIAVIRCVIVRSKILFVLDMNRSTDLRECLHFCWALMKHDLFYFFIWLLELRRTQNSQNWILIQTFMQRIIVYMSQIHLFLSFKHNAYITNKKEIYNT